MFAELQILFYTTKLVEGIQAMAPLAPLSEAPINEDDNQRKGSSRKNHSWSWLKSHLHFSLISTRRCDLKVLLSVIGCPLSPVSLHSRKPIAHVGSQSEYIVKQYEASTKCKKMEKGVRSMYVAGKVQMTMVEEAAAASPVVAQKGCFVIWQMSPDMWLLELVVAGAKIVAGSDGKLAWRHTPWLGAHAARGGPRPLRRFIQGLDPPMVAALFSSAQYMGERQMDEEDCFVLKVAADQSALAERSDGIAEIIKHVIFGYFSQRSGFLVYLEDSFLTRIQSPGTHATYWETTVRSKIDDYRDIDGVLIAHSGRSDVSLIRFGDQKHLNHLIAKMEEKWVIDDVVFNVPGLSPDCFIPPGEVAGTVPAIDPLINSTN